VSWTASDRAHIHRPAGDVVAAPDARERSTWRIRCSPEAESAQVAQRSVSRFTNAIPSLTGISSHRLHRERNRVPRPPLVPLGHLRPVHVFGNDYDSRPAWRYRDEHPARDTFPADAAQFARMNQTTDFLNNTLLPLTKVRKGSDLTQFDVTRTAWGRVAGARQPERR
jgi:hypothetical protein